MIEETICEENGIKVTTARVEVEGKMFTTASISGVRIKHTSTSVIAVITIVMGGAIWFGSHGRTPVLIIGALFILVGLGMSYLSRRSILFVTTPHGEVKALTHGDAKFVGRVESAIKKTIAARA